ncbi:MAG: N-acetylglucosamine-6-phosphate deacetylase [Lentisphaerae bacterium]|jgi:N-acetylglucosamine-6-phosphate deacetylase|nr:N-acetylglucosamine-6-phosphate deacetylase [Lentisphaerota bacterium]
MASTLIKNAHLVSPDLEILNASVLLKDGFIQAVQDNPKGLKADETLDAQGKLMVPGFIDTHFHGGMGYEATSSKKEAISIIAEAKAKEGVTSICPTTLTLSEEDLAASLRFIEAYRKKTTGAKIIGTHLEGPYINPECIGAQNPAYVRKPDINEVKRLNDISPVAIVTYAIETEGAIDFTRQLVKLGIVPSCGHTNATMAQYKLGQEQGLDRLTHFCNQMTRLHHREIGLVGAGLYNDSTYIEMICDKIHLCPDMIRLAFKTKPIDKILLITDAMEATGLPDGNYQLGGLAVVVADGAARLASNGALAGSTLQFNTAFKNVVEETRLPLPELVKTTSLNQANSLKLKNIAEIKQGFVADIVILDDNFNVTTVFVDGIKR